jgi:hypothetical protein
MNTIAMLTLSGVVVTLILAIAAVLIVRLAVGEAASADRASILLGIAQVIKAVRGKK